MNTKMNTVLSDRYVSGSDLSFPGDDRNTTIDLIPYRVIDALRKNKNFVIHRLLLGRYC